MAIPVGYRFQPKDEEIITLLNEKKIDPDFSVQTINEVDIYNFEPVELPLLSAIQTDEPVWFFFCAPYYKYANSKRANRRTNTGYWKVTGKGRKIFAKHSKEVIGSKKILVFCKHGDASKKHKSEWVMHEFRSQYNPLNEKDFVICRVERKSNNKPKISKGDDCQSSHLLVSNYRNHVEDKNFSRVETRQLPGHLHMTYDFRNHVAENSILRVEPQLPSHHLLDNSRNHVAEKTIQGVEHEELPDMTFNYRNHVAENIFPMEESQLLHQHVASNSRNHVAEKIFPEIEYQLRSQYLTSGNGNHAAENTLARVECRHLPSHYFNLASDYRNHVAEKKIPRVRKKDESQLLPSHPLASYSRNHVAENTYPSVQSQQLPSHHLISYFRDQVAEHSLSGEESLLLAQIDTLNMCNGLNNDTLPALQSQINVEDVELNGFNDLDHNPFCALQLPINPEQRSSSYSDGFSNDCDVMNFQFASEQEDMNSQLAFQYTYPIEETGHSLPPCFNSSKSITEAHLGDSSGTDIEIDDAWIDRYSPTAAGDYYLDSMCKPQFNSAGEYYK